MSKSEQSLRKKECHGLQQEYSIISNYGPTSILDSVHYPLSKLYRNPEYPYNYMQPLQMELCPKKRQYLAASIRKSDFFLLARSTTHKLSLATDQEVTLRSRNMWELPSRKTLLMVTTSWAKHGLGFAATDTATAELNFGMSPKTDWYRGKHVEINMFPE